MDPNVARQRRQFRENLMYNYGLLMQSVGAASVILGAVAFGFNREANTPVFLIFGGGLALFVGWAMQ